LVPVARAELQHTHPESQLRLRLAGSVVLSMLRGSDVAGRLEGDRFGVLLLEADKRAADRFLRRLRAELERLRTEGELPESVSCSAGAAHYPGEADDPVSLSELASARQLDAKRATYPARSAGSSERV